MKKMIMRLGFMLGHKTLLALLFMTLSQPHLVAKDTVRVKDLVNVEGVRGNDLVGFGLVMGLQGTGDSSASLSTNKAVSNLLTRLGSEVTEQQVTTNNLAAVIVSAELPPFAQIGDRIDVRVSSVGDASSLQGGSLIMTPLRGADNQIYVVAQGHISLGSATTGQFGGSAAADSTILTVGTSQARVERTFPSSFVRDGHIHLSLKDHDFTTASRLVQAINSFYGEFLAHAKSAGQVQVRVPSSVFSNPSFQLIDFVAALEQIEVRPDSKAKVVINERTGTIIAGENVRVRPVAISHGFLEISTTKDAKEMVGEFSQTTTLSELVHAMNAFGAGPKDIVSILQALEKAGAINAELIFL